MSCLFVALGRLVGVTDASLRQQLCDFMQEHLDTSFQDTKIRTWIAWQGVNPSQYIAQMRSRSEWGGAMEIAIFTQLYRTDVEVVNRQEQRVAEFIAYELHSAPRRLRIMWTGNHYEPVAVLRDAR